MRPSIGRIFKIGHQPINANIAAYYNVVTPTTPALTGSCARSGHSFFPRIDAGEFEQAAAQGRKVRFGS
jgi:hypothetical protein